MEFRRYHGENITGESWIVRDIWQIADVKIRGGRTGLATHPQKIKIDAIKVIIIRALYEQGVREALPEGQRRRHEFKGAHGFRKFFKTHAEQFMNHSNVELLLGHSADALQASYYKPTEKDVLSDYLKAADVLSIDYDKNTLTKQVAELAERNEEQNYIIKGKLAEKEKETEETKKEIQAVRAKLEAYERDEKANKQTLQAIVEQIREEENLQRERENLMMDLVRGIWENRSQLANENKAHQIGSVIAEFEKEIMTTMSTMNRLEGTTTMRGKKKEIL